MISRARLLCKDNNRRTVRLWLLTFRVADPAQRPTMKQVCSSLFAASKKYPAPPAEKFTLNTIKGVSRVSPETHLTVIVLTISLYMIVSLGRLTKTELVHHLFLVPITLFADGRDSRY